MNAGYQEDIPEAHVKMLPSRKRGDWGCGFLFLAVSSITTITPFSNMRINSVLVTRISCSCPQCILPTSYGENAKCKASGYPNSTASSPTSSTLPPLPSTSSQGHHFIFL